MDILKHIMQQMTTLTNLFTLTTRIAKYDTLRIVLSNANGLIHTLKVKSFMDTHQVDILLIS